MLKLPHQAGEESEENQRRIDMCPVRVEVREIADNPMEQLAGPSSLSGKISASSTGLGASRDSGWSSFTKIEI